MLTRGPDGKWIRTRFHWTPERWDDGVISRGRFRVYRPDFPRAYRDGYALRAHVVWWLAKGEAHPKELQLHHKDDDMLNDALDNLELLTHSEHQRVHRGAPPIPCDRCGTSFSRKLHKRRYSHNFCSANCYNEARRRAA